MSVIRSASAIAVAAVMSVGVVSRASAADLPVKAPVPAVTNFPLDVHGYADLTIASGRVTPGGLRIYPNRGSLTQIDTGLALDLYKNSMGFINSFTVFGGIWNEYWSSPPVGGRKWQEMDWWAGASIGFAQAWKLSAQMLQFEFPNGPTDYNYVFSLSYSDKSWGLPIQFNPYVNLFYAASGPSTVVLGDNGKTYRVEIGMRPSLSMSSVPLSFSFPTWVTVGPSTYWNRNDGTTNRCGTLGTAPCATSGVGVFSTGIQAKYSLAGVIPTRLGNWYVKAGVQYYHILNDALLAAQVATGAATSFANAKQDVFIASGGVGFSF